MEIFFVKTIQENCHLSCHTRKFLYEFCRKFLLEYLQTYEKNTYKKIGIQENCHTNPLLIGVHNEKWI